MTARVDPEPAIARTRLAAFLVSAHAGLARRASLQALFTAGAGGVALQAAAAQSAALVSVLLRATPWVPDPWTMLRAWSWELLWLPRPVAAANGHMAPLIDMAALGVAIASVLRPMVLLPPRADPTDPFIAALSLVELEGGRLLQPYLRLLKAEQHGVDPAAAEAAVAARRDTLAETWREVSERARSA